MILIGSKIKNIRIHLGLTVEFLSQKLGVSRSYLTLIENGERRLPKKLIKKLAKALKLSEEVVYDWFLEQELITVGITDKKSHELIENILKMTAKEKESLLSVVKNIRLTQSKKFKGEKNVPHPPNK